MYILLVWVIIIFTGNHNLSDYDFNSVPNAENMRFGIVLSEWNNNITGPLLEEKDYRTNDNLIIGRNAVIELLKSGREVENVLVAKGGREGSINRIIAMCRENKIVVKTVDRKKLDFM